MEYYQLLSLGDWSQLAKNEIYFCFGFFFLEKSVKMAHFNFEKMLNEAIKLDGPLQNGPKFRYERKPMEKKGSESSLGTESFHNIVFASASF